MSVAAHHSWKKREILETLPRSVLVEIVDTYKIKLSDRRRRHELLDVLVRTSRLDVDDILKGLTVEQLKMVCLGLRLNDDGDEKEILIKRIVGDRQDGEPVLPLAVRLTQLPSAVVEDGRRRTIASKTISRSQNNASTSAVHLSTVLTDTQDLDVFGQNSDNIKSINGGPGPETESKKEANYGGHRLGEREIRSQVPIVNAAKVLAPVRITEELFKDYITKSLDILRSHSTNTDDEFCILVLLFLKWVSDVFEDEAEGLIANASQESQDEEPKHAYAFFVPPKARWQLLLHSNQNLGELINKACLSIEEHNPAVSGVLSIVDFASDSRLGDISQRDELLVQLIEHISTLRLRSSDFVKSDIIAKAHTYLSIGTPDKLTIDGLNWMPELLLRLSEPEHDMRVCCVNTCFGDMYLAGAKYLRKQNIDLSSMHFEGQELRQLDQAICILHLLFRGIRDFRIEYGDLISSPKLLTDDSLTLYERVICRSAITADRWSVEAAKTDEWKRFSYGVPSRTKPGLAYLMHMLATLAEAGRLVAVMPQSILSSSGTEAKIRLKILEQDLFEAVIQLPPAAGGNTNCILIMNLAKSEARKEKVLFVQTSRDPELAISKQSLDRQDVTKLVSTYQKYEAVEGYSSVEDLSHIIEGGAHLNVARYISPDTVVDELDVNGILKQLKRLEVSRSQAESSMYEVFKSLGYDVR